MRGGGSGLYLLYACSRCTYVWVVVYIYSLCTLCVRMCVGVVVYIFSMYTYVRGVYLHLLFVYFLYSYTYVGGGGGL